MSLIQLKHNIVSYFFIQNHHQPQKFLSTYNNQFIYSRKQHNDTSFQSQWQKDDAKIQARRAATAQREAAILGRMHGTKQQKQTEREQAATEMKSYMERVKTEAARQKAQESKEAKAIAQVENNLIAQQDAKVVAQREFSAKMMQQNRELCEFRYEQRQSDQKKEKQEDVERFSNHFMQRFGTSLQ